MRNAFFGYPSKPQTLVDNISAGIEQFRERRTSTELCPWTEIDGSSTPIIADVLKCIKETQASFFDITSPNQNVFYEIGYAVGLGKEIFLTVNDALKGAMDRQVELGIFDTHRLKRYRNGNDLANIIHDARDPYHQTIPGLDIDIRQPIFFQHHLAKIEFATSYFSCVKEQKWGLRSYDPEEDHRLPLDRAYREISISAGAFLSLIPDDIIGSEEHNLRAFLLAGIAEAAGVPYALLKHGSFITAFDLRDRVDVVNDRTDIQSVVLKLQPRINERQQQMRMPRRPVARSHIASLSLGASAAENERNSLGDYFLETREFRQALQGNARLVIGRKGSGKTAIFWQVRDRIRGNKSNVVLDLRPESYQLLKLSEIIADHFSEATHSHTMTLFWEYVLYLELAHKIIEDDKSVYTRDSKLTEKYRALWDAYGNVDEFREGDFPERLLQLINRLRQDVKPKTESGTNKILTAPEISELIYKTDFRKIRDQVIEYLSLKSRTLILVDNLDRGWTTAGVTKSDIRIVQSLIDAGRRLERTANKADVTLTTIIFLRDDVYVWLVNEACDRGKDSTIRIQWRDPEMLTQMIERRLEVASLNLRIEPFLIWDNIAQGAVDGRPILDYLIHHCLRRPRSLLDLIEQSLSNASLAGRRQIAPEDAERAVGTYSTDMLRDLNYEVRDVFPGADKIMYGFAQQSARLDKKNVERIANRQLKDANESLRFVKIMLWFGFFGVLGPDGQESYVFDHGDDMDLLLSHAGKTDNPILCIHPLFDKALSLRKDLLF